MSYRKHPIRPTHVSTVSASGSRNIPITNVQGHGPLSRTYIAPGYAAPVASHQPYNSPTQERSKGGTGRPVVPSSHYDNSGSSSSSSTSTTGARSRSKPQTQGGSLSNSLRSLLHAVPDCENLLKKDDFRERVIAVNKEIDEGKDAIEELKKQEDRANYYQQKYEEASRLQEKEASKKSGGKKDSKYNEAELLETLKDFNTQNQELKENNKKLQEEKASLLQRLSKIAGTKLSDNNPNITDLSDPRRPHKLAEQFSRLYDDPWSDALEILQKKSKKTPEKTLTDYLLNVFKECYFFCENLSRQHLTHVIQLLLIPTVKEDSIPVGGDFSSAVSQELSKNLKETRKMKAESFLPYLQEHAAKDGRLYQFISSTDTRAYTQSCISLCWYCVIQDPPVTFLWEVPTDKPFDINVYRTYDRSGKVAEYMVWPAMLLHERGPVLSKGVVQPKKK